MSRRCSWRLSIVDSRRSEIFIDLMKKNRTFVFIFFQDAINDPETMLKNVLEQVHYQSDSWRDRAHKETVRSQFAEMFQLKYVRRLFLVVKFRKKRFSSGLFSRRIAQPVHHADRFVFFFTSKIFTNHRFSSSMYNRSCWCWWRLLFFSTKRRKKRRFESKKNLEKLIPIKSNRIREIRRLKDLEQIR